MGDLGHIAHYLTGTLYDRARQYQWIRPGAPEKMISGSNHPGSTINHNGQGNSYYNNSGSSNSSVVNQNLVYPRKPGESGGRNMGLTFLSGKSWVNNLIAGVNIVNVAGLNLLNWINVATRIFSGTAPINSNPGEKSRSERNRINTSGNTSQSNSTDTSFLNKFMETIKSWKTQMNTQIEANKKLAEALKKEKETYAKISKRIKKLEAKGKSGTSKTSKSRSGTSKVKNPAGKIKTKTKKSIRKYSKLVDASRLRNLNVSDRINSLTMKKLDAKFMIAKVEYLHEPSEIETEQFNALARSYAPYLVLRPNEDIRKEYLDEIKVQMMLTLKNDWSKIFTEDEMARLMPKLKKEIKKRAKAKKLTKPLTDSSRETLTESKKREMDEARISTLKVGDEISERLTNFVKDLDPNILLDPRGTGKLESYTIESIRLALILKYDYDWISYFGTKEYLRLINVLDEDEKK